jgi:hypothetical protein
MSFPALLLKSTWIPNSSLELSIRSVASLLLFLLLSCCYGRFSSTQFPLLTTSTDLIINLLISSVISSSYSHGWLSFCNLLHCTSSLQMGRSTRSPLSFSSSIVALSCHSIVDSDSAILSLSYCSTSFFNILASASYSIGSTPASSSCSSDWNFPSSVIACLGMQSSSSV